LVQTLNAGDIGRVSTAALAGGEFSLHGQRLEIETLPFPDELGPERFPVDRLRTLSIPVGDAVCQTELVLELATQSGSNTYATGAGLERGEVVFRD
jgi:hypothetical protein